MPGQNQVTFYEHYGSGWSWTITGPTWVSWVGHVGIWNDVVSAVRVGPWTTVHLCEHMSFGGRWVSFSTGGGEFYTDFEYGRYGFNDRLSSFIILRNEPSDDRCRRGWYSSDSGVLWRVTTPSDRQKERQSARGAYDHHYYWGWTTCTPPTHDWTTRETQTYYDNTHYTGADYFVKYQPNGAKQYCRQKHVERGWTYQWWSPTNWNEFDPKRCDLYDRTSAPAIRAYMSDFQLAYVSNGVSRLHLSQATYTSAQMGAMAGAVTKIFAPRNFFVRAYAGDNQTGLTTDYTGEIDLGTVNNRVRSLGVNPRRPMLVSRDDTYLPGSKMALLMNDAYGPADLDDGVFGSGEPGVRAGIIGVWVPPGFRVTVTDRGGRVYDFFGHNANGMAWLSINPASIQVRVVLPIAFTLARYDGYVSLLVPGKNAGRPDRPVASLRIPKGYVARCDTAGRPTDTRTGDSPTLPRAYDTITVEVLYNQKTAGNMIDNFPVRTEKLASKPNFEAVCKKSCDQDYDCTAYYAVRNMRRCPNPAAAGGEDPANNGCEQICGYYDNQTDNVRNAKYTQVEPYLFAGNLHVKQADD